MDHTVGWFRNPAETPVEGKVVYHPIYLRGFQIHPRWLGMGFLNHRQYLQVVGLFFNMKHRVQGI